MLPLIDLHRFYHLDGETPEDAIVIYMKEMKGRLYSGGFHVRAEAYRGKAAAALIRPGFPEKTGISGCSIMGNGKICAALDTETVINRYEREDINGSLYWQRASLHSGKKIKAYAVEIPYITELCIQMQLSLIPCLPDCFAGVCNYKGKYCSGRGAGREKAGEEQGYGAHYGMGKVSDGNPFFR